MVFFIKKEIIRNYPKIIVYEKFMFNSWQFMLNRNRLQLVSYHVSNGELGLKMKSGFDHCMLEHDFAEAPFPSFQRRERNIPRLGTRHSKAWNETFLGLEQSIPRLGTKHSLPWNETFQGRELTKHQSRRRTSAGNRVLP